ncbi:MAG: hypothetical protein CL589_02180 [Alteromonadaceae bacterium]|nr:hypothetical protein [Alteromonadaceae bacterium]MAX41441.1 hypothetical protein [Alteromonadaceae bacterium]|tara:strand:+ start:402 stop:650 length:249 start_codon:yes stop_codon:yes gene_type:complete
MQTTLIINLILLVICVPITVYVCFRATRVIVHGILTYMFPQKIITVTLKGPNGTVKKQFSASSNQELVQAILEDRVVENEKG